MNCNFEFVPGDTITVAPGRTVKRIRAVAAIAVFDVSVGDLGGYVESHAQVSGNAWVSGNARVYGDARVSGNARVYGDAQVSGNAWVSGNARVYGDARVSGNARVYGDAQVSGNAQVYGNAQVSGNAWVSGNARVYGDAQVSGNAQVYGNAWVSGNAQVSQPKHILMVGPIGSRAAMLTVHVDSKIGIRYSTGCFSGSRDEFAAAVEASHGDNEHARAYEAAIFLADLVVSS